VRRPLVFIRREGCPLIPMKCPAYQEEHKGEVGSSSASYLAVLLPTLLERFYCLQIEKAQKPPHSYTPCHNKCGTATENVMMINRVFEIKLFSVQICMSL